MRQSGVEMGPLRLSRRAGSRLAPILLLVAAVTACAGGSSYKGGDPGGALMAALVPVARVAPGFESGNIPWISFPCDSCKWPKTYATKIEPRWDSCDGIAQHGRLGPCGHPDSTTTDRDRDREHTNHSPQQPMPLRLLSLTHAQKNQVTRLYDKCLPSVSMTAAPVVCVHICDSPQAVSRSAAMFGPSEGVHRPHLAAVP